MSCFIPDNEANIIMGETTIFNSIMQVYNAFCAMPSNVRNTIVEKYKENRFISIQIIPTLKESNLSKSKLKQCEQLIGNLNLLLFHDKWNNYDKRKKQIGTFKKLFDMILTLFDYQQSKRGEYHRIFNKFEENHGFDNKNARYLLLQLAEHIKNKKLLQQIYFDIFYCDRKTFGKVKHISKNTALQMYNASDLLLKHCKTKDYSQLRQAVEDFKYNIA